MQNVLSATSKVRLRLISAVGGQYIETWFCWAIDILPTIAFATHSAQLGCEVRRSWNSLNKLGTYISGRLEL